MSASAAHIEIRASNPVFDAWRDIDSADEPICALLSQQSASLYGRPCLVDASKAKWIGAYSTEIGDARDGWVNASVLRAVIRVDGFATTIMESVRGTMNLFVPARFPVDADPRNATLSIGGWVQQQGERRKTGRLYNSDARRTRASFYLCYHRQPIGAVQEARFASIHKPPSEQEGAGVVTIVFGDEVRSAEQMMLVVNLLATALLGARGGDYRFFIPVSDTFMSGVAAAGDGGAVSFFVEQMIRGRCAILGLGDGAAAATAVIRAWVDTWYAATMCK